MQDATRDSCQHSLSTLPSIQLSPAISKELGLEWNRCLVIPKAKERNPWVSFYLWLLRQGGPLCAASPQLCDQCSRVLSSWHMWWASVYLAFHNPKQFLNTAQSHFIFRDWCWQKLLLRTEEWLITLDAFNNMKVRFQLKDFILVSLHS